MGLQKVAFNFMVERGGKIAKSLLCTKPQKITNIAGLQYKHIFEKIKYKKAKTFEEAEIFAKEKLDLKYNFNEYKPDVSVMNQVNESLTKAYNKTGKKAFDEICLKKEKTLKEAETTRATNLVIRINGKIDKIVLQLNPDIFNLSRGIVNGKVKRLIDLGLIDKEDNITLLGDFLYEHTLNRYYKLHQNGNFSVYGKRIKAMDKARMDYLDLLTKAIEQHERILAQKTSIKKLLRNEFNINIPENLTDDEYDIFVTKILLENKNNAKVKSFINEFSIHSRAIGFDRTILHEAGHAYQFRSKPYPEKFELNKTEYDIARDISRRAVSNSREFVAEEFADLITNNFTSTQNIKDLYRKCGGYCDFIV